MNLLSSLKLRPFHLFLIIQLISSCIIFGLFVLFPALIKMKLLAACLQSIIAARLSLFSEAPRWWWPIHLIFFPLVVIFYDLHISPIWYGGLFIVFLLFFWRTDQSRIPFFLSNSITADAILELLPAHPCFIVDLGCGDGKLLNYLSMKRSDCEFIGIEYAPLPWFISYLRSLQNQHLHVKRTDLWKYSLQGTDVIYTFLSPDPMPNIWKKFQAETRPGTLLISNSFPIPDITPHSKLILNDRRKTHLYCYIKK